MRFAFGSSLAAAMALVAACGGNVVVDQPANGGSGGTSTITIPTGTTTTTVTTSTTVPTGTTSTGTTTSTSTSTTTTTTPPPLPCGGLAVSQNQSCQSCMESTCCEELAACAEGTVCFQLLDCMSVCLPQDTACQSACLQAYESGLGALDTLLACSQDVCGLDQLLCLTPVCGLDDFAALGAFCGECLSYSCCTEFLACVDDGACADCLTNPEAPSCVGEPVYDATVSCVSAHCGLFCF